MPDILSTAPAPAAAVVRSARIASIDALRGLVILLMLVDHSREFFFYHAQVSDPMDVAGIAPDLFFARLGAHLCAPIFVALTGIAACLYAEGKGGAPAASAFLFKRGLFLVLLELTAVSFAWSFDVTPPILFLQVIWVIGLSMIALAALVHLPRAALATIGLVIVFGHNLLDPIQFAPGEPGHIPWAILHDRGFIDLPGGIRARTSYPLLPWIGVIALGYAAGPWFTRGVDSLWRRRRLVMLGAAMLTLFVVARTINLYGDPLPWNAQETPLRTVMSFLNVTKYPPSMDFLLLTLGVGTLLLALFEALPSRATGWLTVFGSVPLFFYLLHLYLLHLLNLAAQAVTGDFSGTYYGVAQLWQVLAIAALVAVPCWFACRWFAAKKRASGAWWMRYL